MVRLIKRNEKKRTLDRQGYTSEDRNIEDISCDNKQTTPSIILQDNIDNMSFNDLLLYYNDEAEEYVDSKGQHFVMVPW